MKKVILILMPLAVLAVVSCQKELAVNEGTDGSFYLEARISDEAVTPPPSPKRILISTTMLAKLLQACILLLVTNWQ